MSPNLELFSTTLKMLVSLAVVLGGMFIVFYFMRKVLNQKTSSGNKGLIRILGNTYVGIKKNITLVQVPGAVLVVGITNDHISLLDKIDDAQTLNRLKSTEEEPRQESFFQHFQNLSQKIINQETNKSR